MRHKHQLALTLLQGVSDWEQSGKLHRRVLILIGGREFRAVSSPLREGDVRGANPKLLYSEDSQDEQRREEQNQSRHKLKQDFCLNRSNRNARKFKMLVLTDLHHSYISINAQQSVLYSPVGISQSVQRVLTGGHTRRNGGDLKGKRI